MAAITIFDRTATGRPVDSITLNGLPDQITVGDLIRTRVREEVARHNLTLIDSPKRTFRGLVTPTNRETNLNEPRTSPHRVDWAAQAKVAVDAFGRNGFFVLVNGRQAVDLEQEVDLTAAADVAFVRLLPLIGG